MKILITESQYNHIITEHKFGSSSLPESLYKRRLKKAKELAVNYPNPRQFALKHKKLWNFLRGNKLVDDVFTNRKKYNEDLTDEKVRELASKYVSVSDFEVENGTAYQYALRNNLIKDLFPNYPFREDPLYRRGQPGISILYLCLMHLKTFPLPRVLNLILRKKA